MVKEEINKKITLSFGDNVNRWTKTTFTKLRKNKEESDRNLIKSFVLDNLTVHFPQGIQLQIIKETVSYVDFVFSSEVFIREVKL